MARPPRPHLGEHLADPRTRHLGLLADLGLAGPPQRRRQLVSAQKVAQDLGLARRRAFRDQQIEQEIHAEHDCVAVGRLGRCGRRAGLDLRAREARGEIAKGLHQFAPGLVAHAAHVRDATHGQSEQVPNG